MIGHRANNQLTSQVLKTLRSKFLFVLATALSLTFSAHAQGDAAERAKLEGTWVGGVTNPGIPRPTAFFTKPQVQFHMVLTRKK